MKRYLGIILMLLATLCWGIIGSLTRFSLERNVPPAEIAFWRLCFASAFFILHALWIGQWRISSWKDGLAFFLFGSVSIAMFFTSAFSAVKHGGAALAVILMYTSPLWVAVLARLLFREKISFSTVLAMSGALLGVFCISLAGKNGGSSVTFAALGFGLLSGLLYASHFIMAKLYLNRYHSITMYGYGMLFGCIALLPFVDFVPKVSADWGVFFILALVSSYIGYWLYAEGVKRLETTKAAILTVFEPLLSMFMAWWWWDESFTSLGWMGVALIIAAVCLLLVMQRKQNISSSSA